MKDIGKTNASVANSIALRFNSTMPGGKSWVPTQKELLQRVTTQALVHEISLQQMEVTLFIYDEPLSFIFFLLYTFYLFYAHIFFNDINNIYIYIYIYIY
jgi:hypothetical protein